MSLPSVELTKQDYEKVIRIANGYPSGFGMAWGHGPLANTAITGNDDEEIYRILAEHPEYVEEFGWPVLVVAAGRGELNGDLCESVLHRVSDAFDAADKERKYQLGYVSALDKEPEYVAKVFQWLIDSAEGDNDQK